MSSRSTRDRGELEAAVLRSLRRYDEAVGARDIQSSFDEPAPAYTTILTVLDRLAKKGEVIKDDSHPRAVTFRAVRSETESASAAMLDTLDGVEDRRAALMRFAGNLTAEDADLLAAALGRGKRHAPGS